MIAKPRQYAFQSQHAAWTTDDLHYALEMLDRAKNDPTAAIYRLMTDEDVKSMLEIANYRVVEG